MTPAENHRWIAQGFTDRVQSAPVDAWDSPAPVEGWVARDVVRHLVDWLAAFLEGGAGVTLERGPSVDEDPVKAWDVHAAGVQRILDDPASAELTLSNPHIGDIPLPDAIDRFYTHDVFMHTWDLARATGGDEHLDDDTCRGLLAGMQPIEEMLRGSGQYGPRVEVPPDASPVEQLMGFIGREVRGDGRRG